MVGGEGLLQSGDPWDVNANQPWLLIVNWSPIKRNIGPDAQPASQPARQPARPVDGDVTRTDNSCG